MPGPKSRTERIDTLKRFIDIATLFIIAFGLYFAADQAKKLSDSIRASNAATTVNAWANMTSQTLNLDDAFIAHPDFQKFFYEGAVVDPASPQYTEISAIAVKLLDYLDSMASFVSLESGSLPNSMLDPPAWHRYFVASFRGSPILCKVYLPIADQYGPELRKIAMPTCSVKAAARKPAAVPSSREFTLDRAVPHSFDQHLSFGVAGRPTGAELDVASMA